MGTGDRSAGAGLLIRRLTFRPQKLSVKHIMDQGRFPRTGNAGDAGENAERQLHVSILKIMLARAGDFDRSARCAAFFRKWNGFNAAEVIARERLGSARSPFPGVISA